MPRRPQGNIPLLELDAESAVPLYRQLVEALRQAILTGRLAEQTRLPSTRSLAQDLAVSRSTVVTAYEQLISEGYLLSRSGSGTVVPAGLALLDFESTGGSPPGAGTGPPRASTAARPPAPFRPGIPALDEFASSAFGRIMRRVFGSAGPELFTAGAPQGDTMLRECIARHLRGSRKVRCSPEDIIVTSGAQEALSLAFDVVTVVGDEVWMENPGYSGARAAAEVTGARPVPVPVDRDGMIVSEGIRRWPAARGAYVTPSHQFPTGGTLALTRRLELLEWAARERRYVIEDDYDSEFRLEGRPLPSLQGLDQEGRVIYVGTFSKSLSPGLRLGFLVLPPALFERACRMKEDRTGPQPPWLQRTAAVFMEEGHFARHVRRTRALYRDRRDALRSAAASQLDGVGRLREPTGAMHAVLDLPAGSDPVAVAHRARAAGIEVLPLSYFVVPPDEVTDAALLLGFGGYAPAAIRRGIAGLRQAIEAEG